MLGVIGHLNSGQTIAAMEEYAKMPLVVITPTASEPSITAQGYKNFFRVNANDTVQADTLVRFLTQKLGAKSVAVLYNDSTYGKTLGQEMKTRLAKAGASVAADIQIKEGQSVFTTEVPQVQKAAPDAIFYAGYEIETPYLRDALVSAGLKVPMVASDGAVIGFVSMGYLGSNGVRALALDGLLPAFQQFILTHNDEAARDTLRNQGAGGPMLQYLLLNEIQDPGSCSGPSTSPAGPLGK